MVVVLHNINHHFSLNLTSTPPYILQHPVRKAMASEMADSQQRSLNRLRDEMRNEMKNEVLHFKEEIRKEVESGLKLDQVSNSQPVIYQPTIATLSLSVIAFSMTTKRINDIVDLLL